VRIKRAYEPRARGDGRRILIDRLWPRGCPREALRIDAWPRELAPSDALRRWFAHDPRRWREFRRRYQLELYAASATRAWLRRIAARAGRHLVTLVYAARDKDRNDAVVVAKMFERLGLSIRTGRARDARRP
jgi:uncharacterized protein YeaO (DUF488 family)